MSRDYGNEKGYEKVSVTFTFAILLKIIAITWSTNRFQSKFGDATQNWLNFQTTFKPEETFKTSTGEGIKPFADRTEPFKLKDNALTADPAAVDAYREQWT